MIPADAPPSLDGHREGTYATVHAVAPFYSVLMRVNPDNPADTTRFRLRSVHWRSRQPTDDGKTYTFKIREGVKFQDGTPLDRGRCGGELARDHLSAARRAERAAELVFDGRYGRGARPHDRGVPAEVRHQRFPAGARRSICVHLREEDPRHRPALVREPRHGLRPVPLRRLRHRPVDQGRAQSGLLSQGPAVPGWLHRHVCAEAGGAGRCHPLRPRGDRVPRPAALGARRTDKDLGDKLAVQTSDWNCGN